MADELKILIKTGFNVDIAELTKQLEAIQEKTKLNLGGDLTKQIRQAKELAALENKQLQNEKVKLQNERLLLQNEKAKAQTSQSSEKSTLQAEKLRLQNERLALQNEMSIIQKEKASKTEQDTQKIARQNEVYSNLLKLVKEQYQIETKLLTEKDAKLQQQLTKELEINKARQSTYNNSVKNESLFNAESESKLLTQQYNLKQKMLQQEKELADAKKASTQFSSQGLAQSFYENIIKLSKEYNNNLISSIDLKKKLDALMYKKDGNTVSQFNNLDSNKQDQLTNIYSKVALDAQNKAYVQLNKLLTEEYNLRIRIEEAKLSRYEAKDNSIEEERVTVLERELQKRLEINQAQREVVNNNINDNGLANQEKLNQLQKEEINLKSELAIKVAQVASSQQLLTAKTQNDLDNFSKGMSVNLDGLARKYDYVSGASKKIDEFRQTIAGVTAENGKLYVSTVQADGSVKKSQTTIQALRMQYRQLRNEIQGSITIFDTLKQNLRKFGSWIIGGSIFMQFTRGITSAVTTVNELSDAITTLRRVSSGTEADYQNLASDMFKIADQIGGSAKALVDSMAEFSKLGYDFAEAKNLAEQASKYASAGDMSVNDATTSLISTYQVFNGQLDKHIGKVITATEITDLFNEAGNRLSVTSEQVGGALQRSANALSLANNSFSESVALIASANKSIQNAETVGRKKVADNMQQCVFRKSSYIG